MSFRTGRGDLTPVLISAGTECGDVMLWFTRCRPLAFEGVFRESDVARSGIDKWPEGRPEATCERQMHFSTSLKKRNHPRQPSIIVIDYVSQVSRALPTKVMWHADQ